MQVLNPMSMTIRYSPENDSYENTLIELDNGLGNEYTLRQWMCLDPRCAECTRK